MKVKLMTRRVMSIAFALSIVGTLLSGCSSDNSSKSASSNNEDTVKFAEEAFAKIEPLEETQALVVGSLSSSTHGFNNYLIEKLGGYEKANLDAEVMVFGNGPIMVEAMTSGDCDAGIYGVGGTLAGTIGQDFINLGAASRDYHALQFYSPKDSEIVKSGNNHIKESPELYGTSDLWKGKEIFLPLGTTLHYLLSKGLEKLELTTDDVKLTHMEVPNINTALRAGKCEIGGVWTNYPYGSLNEIATPVMKASDVGVILVTSFATTPKIMEDKAKKEAVKKWMELYFAAVDWMYASDENLNQAIDWFMEWNDENGIASVREEIEAHCKYQACYTLKDNMDMIKTNSENGDYNLFIEYNIEPLKFFVDQGNYKPEDINKFLEPQYIDTTFIEELSAK